MFMTNNNPVEYTNVDQRNDLKGPDDPNKRDYPNRPQHVSIDSEQTGQNRPS